MLLFDCRSAKLPHTYVQFGKLFDKVGTPPQCVTALSATDIADDTSGISDGTCMRIYDYICWYMCVKHAVQRLFL
jgi:hypothetical protein